jgi:hypothetical protein
MAELEISSYLSNQIATLKSAEDRPTYGSRYIGGHNRLNQPFISGYHQIWVQFPEMLFGTEASSESLKWLTATCEGFTPHSTTMNFIDVNGIGQLGSSFPSSRTVNREFTLTFREYRNSPILNVFRIWHGLFDPHTGITSVKGKDLIPINYKGLIMVGVLRPTATSGPGQVITEEDVEDVLCYEGVFPSVCPEDTALAADQATNETVQLSITFKFDGAPLDKTKPGLLTTFIDKISNVNYSTVYNFIGQTSTFSATEIPSPQ